MDWGNVVVKKIHMVAGIIKSVDALLHLDSDFRTTTKKLTCLADTDHKTKVDLVDFDHLITKDKLEKEDDLEDFITPQSEFHTYSYAEINVRELQAGAVIQFERKGYFRVDKGYKSSQTPILLIPDGKTVSRYGTPK